MTPFSREAHDRAVAFIRGHARPVDRALFAFWFEGGPAAQVAGALAAFRNEDGGFGRALEPDFRLPDSSPVATSLALQYLAKIGATSESSELARGAVRYLVRAYDGGWIKVPAQVNDHPHAFWWHVDEAPGGWEANPSAELLAALYRYGELVEPAFVAGVEADALAALARAGETLERHDAMCWQRLAEAAPPAVRFPVMEKLNRLVPAIVSFDPAEWAGYGARPLSFAPSPAAPLHPVVAQGIEADLDFVVETQLEDGSWAPNWDWGQYPEVWPAARRDWQGYLTVHNLKLLEAYGRLAEKVAH